MVTNNEKVYASDFVAINMQDDGTNGDAVAGDNIYTAIMPFQNFGEVVKYYVRAQNDDALQLRPEKAEYEFYTYEVGNTSTNTQELDLNISIAPNPFTEKAMVKFPTELKAKQIRFLDAFGKVVRTVEPASGNTIEIEKGNLPAGNYFLEIQTNNRKISKKIVIQ